jgi:hypothetical protein
MEAWSDLLRGVAAVLWPIVILVLLLIFRPEVTGLFSRLRKAKLLGQEVELDESLDKLNRSAVTLTAEEIS